MENQEEFSGSGNLEITYAVEEQKSISLNKFIFLSIVSFGTYEIWWIYKAWRFFNQKDNLNIMPAVRTVFSIFFLIPLFYKMLNFAKEKNYNYSYSSILLFTGFFIANLLAYLPVPYLFIALVSVVFLIPPYKAFNFARQNSNDFLVTEQTSYNGRQIALIVIGVIFWFFVLLGLIKTNVSY